MTRVDIRGKKEYAFRNMHPKTPIRVENEASGEVRRFATLTEATRFHINILGEPSSTNPSNKNRRTKTACKNNSVVAGWKFFWDEARPGQNARTSAPNEGEFPVTRDLCDPVNSTAPVEGECPDTRGSTVQEQSTAPGEGERPDGWGNGVQVQGTTLEPTTSTHTDVSSGNPDFFTFTDEVDAMFAGKKLRICEIDETKFVSAYDIIELISDRPRQAHRIYSDIMTTYPEMKVSTKLFQFPGERQRPTRS